jgi:hypothetical protein
LRLAPFALKHPGSPGVRRLRAPIRYFFLLVGFFMFAFCNIFFPLFTCLRGATFLRAMLITPSRVNDHHAGVSRSHV